MERSEDDADVTMGDMVGKLSDDGDPVAAEPAACCGLAEKFNKATGGVEDGQSVAADEEEEESGGATGGGGGGGRMTLVKWMLGTAAGLAC